jgi:YHS domain-containing protein/thiol-disulfide isomerase/thioredoxin
MFARILVLALLSGVAMASQSAYAQGSIPWQPNLEAAKREAAATNRLLLVHFWTTWCEPCERLNQEVFAQPQVQQAIVRDFVPVKLNADLFPSTARLYGIDSLPADVILAADGQFVARINSPPTPSGYLAELSRVVQQARPTVVRPGAVGSSATLAAGPMVPPPNMAAAPPDPVAWPPSATMPQSGPLSPGTSTPPAAASQAQPPADRYPVLPGERPADPYAATPGARQPEQSANRYAATPADRYADHYQDRYVDRYFQPPHAATVGPNPAASVPSGPPTDSHRQPDFAAAPTVVGPPGFSSPPSPPAAAQAVAGQPWAAPPNQTAPGAPAASTPSLPSPAASGLNVPPLGLDGFCPVTLAEQQRWQAGDRRYGVIHRGSLYLFASEAEKQRFWADPDRFSPILSGHDAVLATDQGTAVPGRREFGVTYQNRVYLFSSEDSRRQFSQNPNRYAQQVLQAEAQHRSTLR